MISQVALSLNLKTIVLEKYIVDYMKTKYRNCPLCNEINVQILTTLKKTDIVRCLDCNMVFADITVEDTLQKNILSKEEFYKYVKEESSVTRAYYDKLLDTIKYNSKLSGKLKLLDFGCGTGQLLIRAEKKELEAYGSDFSPYAEEAKILFGLNIEIGNILETDYPNNYFDVIVTHATHEHLYNPVNITTKLVKLLKPGGLFVLSGVPNFNILSRRLFNNYYLNSPPGHINFFEKHSINKLFETSNLSRIYIKTYGFDIWYIQNKIRGLRKIKTDGKSQKSQIEKLSPEEIQKMGNNIGFLEKTASRFYEAYGLFLPGKSFEAMAFNN